MQEQDSEATVDQEQPAIAESNEESHRIDSGAGGSGEHPR